MTDRDKDLVLEQPHDDVTSDELVTVDDDLVLDDVHPVPGEEIDPDSLRPVPAVDEDGEVVDPIVEDGEFY